MWFFVLLSAILPAVVLVWLIYRKDKLQPEPIPQLLKGVLWGVASVFVSFCFSIPIMFFFGDGTGNGMIDSAFSAFFTAAIPEEIAKFICLYLFLRKNKYFDEYLDGIVYAVCIGMGFAGLENIEYLFSSGDWVVTGIIRAVISVPGHYAFAVLMGYFFSRWYMMNDKKSMIMMLLAPIVAHGIFDFLLMWMSSVEYLAVVLFFVFVYFIKKMHNYCSRLIVTQRDFDASRMAAMNDHNDNSYTTDA